MAVPKIRINVCLPLRIKMEYIWRCGSCGRVMLFPYYYSNDEEPSCVGCNSYDIVKEQEDD